MQIIKAQSEKFDSIKRITHETISEIYPHYYAKGVVKLFVLPKYQHKGFGRQLLNFAEELIAEEYQEIYLASSLTAKNAYLKRGYITVDTHKIVVENGDVLCYDWMKKECTK